MLGDAAIAMLGEGFRSSPSKLLMRAALSINLASLRATFGRTFRSHACHVGHVERHHHFGTPVAAVAPLHDRHART